MKHTRGADREAVLRPSQPVALAAYQDRLTLRGSSGLPSRVLKTRPESTHAVPAASRSALRRFRRARRAANVGSGTGTVRLDSEVFGSTRISRPLTRWRARRTVSRPVPKSMSLHRSPSNSPLRSPRVSAHNHNASSGSPRIAETSRLASSTVSTRTSWRCTVGGRTSRRRRWPGVSGGLSLGRPARRTPGRTGNGAGSDRLSARRRCTGAVFLALDCPARGHRV